MQTDTKIKTRVAVLVSDTIDFYTKAIIRDKRTFYNDYGYIQQEDITLGNIYMPNIGAPKSIKQMLTDIKLR